MACTTIGNLTAERTTPTNTDWLEIETADGQSMKIKFSTILSSFSRIGEIIYKQTIPSNGLVLNGTEKSKTVYSELYNYALTNNLITTETLWQGGSVGYFSEGVTTGMFRLPDFQGLFPRFAGANSVMKYAAGGASDWFTGGAANSVSNDKVQGHWHSSYGSQATGALYKMYENPSRGAESFLSSSFYAREAITDNVNGTPRTGKETAPASVSVYPIIIFRNIL